MYHEYQASIELLQIECPGLLLLLQQCDTLGFTASSTKLNALIRAYDHGQEAGQKSLPAAPSTGTEGGVLEGLSGILDGSKDIILKHPRVVALALQCVLAIWQVDFLDPPPVIPSDGGGPDDKKSPDRESSSDSWIYSPMFYH